MYTLHTGKIRVMTSFLCTGNVQNPLYKAKAILKYSIHCHHSYVPINHPSASLLPPLFL